MLQFPAIPSWDALHPLIIHFPIALLLISPIFIVVGAVLTPAKGRAYLIAAMVLLLVGTASIFVAVATGEAAGKLAERVPGMEQVLETHESLAERTQAVFSVLSVIFLALLAVPWLLKRADTRLTTTILPLAFLVLYSAGAMLLVNTAHNGGRLVHEFGVRAMVTSAPVDANASLPAETQDKD
ncbi:MAG TPA: DUF2231 domain-containing protein [Candidatus Dormibacteraeota bacterium]|nr:DUF2231 domain-containing protein [Candidatus Dormibacteraeota bacterium]